MSTGKTSEPQMHSNWVKLASGNTAGRKQKYISYICPIEMPDANNRGNWLGSITESLYREALCSIFLWAKIFHPGGYLLKSQEVIKEGL